MTEPEIMPTGKLQDVWLIESVWMVSLISPKIVGE